MEVSHIFVVAVTALTSLLPSGCHKSAPPPATPAGLQACNLGEVAMTNNYETCVQLGGGKNCVLTPKLLDSRNVQITLALESKTDAGNIHDLSVTQIITRLDRPFAVAVGNFSLAMTPKVAAE